jgi:hypothetical protein
MNSLIFTTYPVFLSNSTIKIQKQLYHSSYMYETYLLSYLILTQDQLKTTA